MNSFILIVYQYLNTTFMESEPEHSSIVPETNEKEQKTLEDIKSTLKENVDIIPFKIIHDKTIEKYIDLLEMSKGGLEFYLALVNCCLYTFKSKENKCLEDIDDSDDELVYDYEEKLQPFDEFLFELKIYTKSLAEIMFIEPKFRKYSSFIRNNFDYELFDDEIGYTSICEQPNHFNNNTLEFNTNFSLYEEKTFGIFDKFLTRIKFPYKNIFKNRLSKIDYVPLSEVLLILMKFCNISYGDMIIFTNEKTKNNVDEGIQHVISMDEKKYRLTYIHYDPVNFIPGRDFQTKKFEISFIFKLLN